MSETKWREEDDPEVLAAAIAAGVEVQWVATEPTRCVTADDFRANLDAGVEFRLPAGWSPAPEPPADDLRERIAPNPMAVREFASKVADYVATNVNADAMSKRDWAFEAVVQALEERTASQEARAILAIHTPPVPPWPGAVLSGLVDEDGQPTWLAQAGQVRGEMVRGCATSPWEVRDYYATGAWVEVRAPRPAPATERVQAWEAVRDGRQVVGASSPLEAHYIWRSGPDRAVIGERTMDKAVLVAPDGTVEVLRRDGES